MQIGFGRCLGTQYKIEKRIGTTLTLNNIWNYELFYDENQSAEKTE